ncbi:MAG: hypothetical protein ACTSRU_17925 [Candidatus Hodarchaeales archaeon]
MADKLAVIDDLSEVKGDEGLQLDGVTDYCLLGTLQTYSGVFPAITGTFESVVSTATTEWILGISRASNQTVYTGVYSDTSDTLRVVVRDSNNVTFIGATTGIPVPTGKFKCELSYSDGAFCLFIDSICEWQSVPTDISLISLTNVQLNVLSLTRSTSANLMAGICSEASISSEIFISNVEFGSNDFGETSGGATWNKSVNGQPVSIVAPDQTALLAQLPVTPAETWEVIDTTVGSTVPPTNDVSWLLYDDQYLTVTVQGGEVVASGPLTIKQKRDLLISYYVGLVPGALILEGLEDIPIENFLGELSTEIDELSFAVVLAEGMESTVMADDAFVIQVWLPGQIHASDHASAIWEIVRKTEPSIVGADTKMSNYQSWNAGDSANISGTSNVVFEIAFSNSLDDCEG